MTASNFDGALARVLVHEGGYVHHAADPGGATMKGVTQRVYDGWRRRKGLATRSVRRIAPDEIAAIYRAQYWAAVRADELPPGLDYCLFDAAVNSGPAQATKWLQRTLGSAADGQVGTLTLAALEGRGVAAVIGEVCERRLAMLRTLRTFPTFGAGWTRRVGEVRQAALALARGEAVLPPVDAPPAPTAKARPDDVRLARVPEGAGGLMSGAGALGAVVAEQAQALAPLAEVAPVLRWLFVALLVAGVVLTLHGALARIRTGEVAP